MGIGAYLAGKLEDCVQIAAKGLKALDCAALMRQETAALAMLGRDAAAAASLQCLLARMPDLTIEQVCHVVPVRYLDDQELWLDGLCRAGLSGREI